MLPPRLGRRRRARSSADWSCRRSHGRGTIISKHVVERWTSDDEKPVRTWRAVTETGLDQRCWERATGLLCRGELAARGGGRFPKHAAFPRTFLFATASLPRSPLGQSSIGTMCNDDTTYPKLAAGINHPSGGRAK